MNDNDTVAEVRDSLTTAKDSLAGVHMEMPLDAIARRGRARRRRHQLTGVTGAMAVMAGTALAVATLAPSGQPVSPSGRPDSRPASHTPTARLAAWTVARQVNGDIKVTIRQLSDPAGLQSTLRADGVPASITAFGQPDPACQPYPLTQALFTSVYRGDKTTASGDTVLVIHPSALPAGAGVRIEASVGRHAGGHSVHRAGGPGVNKTVHHAAHQPARHVGADNGVINVGLVDASQQCTGS